MSYTRVSAGDSWQRLSYDPVTYDIDIKQSTQPLRYRMDPLYANPCGQICRPADVGYIGRVGNSIEKGYSLVDTDSEMKLLNYRASKAPQHHFHPKLNQSSCKTGYPGPEAGGIQFELLEQDKCTNPSDKWHFPECRKLRTEYTRVTYPKCDLKGTGVNRFQPICLDPQHPSRWEHPSELGVNYRMVVKDNHRPCIPRPLDQASVLPASQAAAVRENRGITAANNISASPLASGIIDGLPKQKVTLSYCTAASGSYGHKFQCDSKYNL